MLPHELPLSSIGDVARVFGDEFAQKTAKLEPGHWAGPVQSGYGWHVVYVSERTEGRSRPLSEVREPVQREWTAARRKEIVDATYSKMRKKICSRCRRPTATNQRNTATGQRSERDAAAMMRRAFMLLTLALVANVPGIARGHEVRPGYLELRQTGADIWSVLWKVPAQGDMRLSIHPRFPENCALAGGRIALEASGAYTERTTIACKGGLVGRTVAIDGLAATMTDVLVRSMRADDSVQLALVTPSAPAFVYEAAPRSLQVARAYTVLGIQHILRGMDHLLFVLGLLLIVRNKWVLVKTITAFTVAHSITLAAATLGWVHVPQPPVEAVIALSILFLARELAKQHQGQAGLMERYPWIVAFIFGLLHGFGFAGALREVGLPEIDIPLALFTFNVGVEIGQLIFVGTVLLALTALRNFLLRVPAWARAMPAYGIGTMAAVWWLQRMAPLF
jgi:hydrogenase/urease accessory protein HupE